jgi:hypothetical protein
MRFGKFSLTLSLSTILCITSVAAFADHPDISGQAGSDAYEIIGQQANEAAESRGSLFPGESSSQPSGDRSPYVEYRWLNTCITPTTKGPLAETVCSASDVCADANATMYRLWALRRDGVWVPLGGRCFDDSPPDPGAVTPSITPALVLNEIRRIGLPTLQAKTQPEGKTLVNFDTIFYTEAQPFTASVTLLGQQVEIMAEPSRYTWHHGDGTIDTTASPGAPYPSKEIVYRYDAAGTVGPRVDVTYTARFRVNGAAWRGIDEAVTITGPAGSLRVSEAKGSLSGNYG